MLNLRRLEARERRLAALHEAGHAVLARDMGMLGVSAEIWRARDPSPDRRSWAGHVQFLDLLAKNDPLRRRMLGVAGLVAVNLHLNRRSEPSFSGLETLSPSDLAMAGVVRGDDGALEAADRRVLAQACAAVAAVFRDPTTRRLLLRTARRLILEATGRYDGPLFASAFVRPREFHEDLDAMAMV